MQPRMRPLKGTMTFSLMTLSIMTITPGRVGEFVQGVLTEGEGLSTVDLLIKVAR
jgi:hypothetical protein